MALVGIQALSYRNSSCSILCFSKDKSPKLQCYLKQDNQQLRPSHIISINYLDLDQAYATHGFQVQSKSLYQNNRIQNSREFMAKSQVLERNYNRAIIHHFQLRVYSESSLFYSALKNKINTSFILFSILLDHTLLLQLYIFIIKIIFYFVSFIIFYY